MKLRQYEGNHWQLQQLDLATIRSLTPRNALLQPWSWQVTGGLERVPGKHDDETLVAHVNGGAAPGNSPTTCSASPSAPCAWSTTTTSAKLHLPAAGFNTGVLWKNPLGNLSLEAKGDFFTNGEGTMRSISLNQQWELSRNLGLRLSAQREYSHLSTPVNEVMLELKWYHY